MYEIQICCLTWQESVPPEEEKKRTSRGSAGVWVHPYAGRLIEGKWVSWELPWEMETMDTLTWKMAPYIWKSFIVLHGTFFTFKLYGPACCMPSRLPVPCFAFAWLSAPLHSDCHLYLVSLISYLDLRLTGFFLPFSSSGIIFTYQSVFVLRHKLEYIALLRTLMPFGHS